MIQKCSWLIVVLLACTLSFGGIRFSVTTERTAVSLGDQVVVTATIVSNKEIKNSKAPALPQSQHFRLLRTNSNQHQTSSIQIINGKMMQTVEINYLFYYHITFIKEGSFTFPALTFNHGGTAYTSKPFTITVGKKPAKTRDVRVYIRLNKKNIYVGEQCILTVEVAKEAQAPANLTNEGFITVITSLEKAFGKGFSINRLFSNKVGQTQRAIHGVPHQIFTLSFSVIPVKTGAYAIPSIPFEYVELRQVKGRRRDFFDDFFGGSFFGRSIQQIPRTAHSNRLSVTVKSLPPAPSDFSGAVGTFSLNAETSGDRVAAGDAITLHVMLRGTTRPGNMTDFSLPDLPDFEVFKPEKHTYVDTTAKGISTRKKFKYLLIPREEGERIIPPITWTYFNPNTGSYKTASTGQIPITVTKGKKGSKRQARYLTQEDIREVGHDIRYIKTPPRIRHQSTEPHKNPLFFVLFPIPFLIALFALLFRLQATVLRKDPAIQLRRKALSTAKLSLKNLLKDAESSQPVQTVSRIAEIIETYITHRFGFAAVGKTLDELKEELSHFNVEQSVTADLIPFLEELDRCRFGGSSVDKSIVAKLLENTRSLIDKLERKEKKA